MRIGTGYDVHAFSRGRDFILGGVKIPNPEGLEGHSDADVLVHAIMDALLGAAGLPDIGVYFPDSDQSYRNISSLKLLNKTGNIIRDAGYIIVNIDSTIILEKPKVAAYIDDMRKNIANALNVSRDLIGVKATTTEGLGFCGRKEGAAAQAVALIESAV